MAYISAPSGRVTGILAAPLICLVIASLQAQIIPSQRSLLHTRHRQRPQCRLRTVLAAMPSIHHQPCGYVSFKIEIAAARQSLKRHAANAPRTGSRQTSTSTCRISLLGLLEPLESSKNFIGDCEALIFRQMISQYKVPPRCFI